MSSEAIPRGWSADAELMEDYAETTFLGELYGLPGPYQAVMYRGEILEDEVLVQCGGNETDEQSALPIYVFWGPITSEAAQITEPTKLQDILTAMSASTSVTKKENLETKKLLMGGPDAREPYIPVPSGWLAESSPLQANLLEDFRGELYGLIPPYRPVLRTVEEDMFVIVTSILSKVTFTDSKGELRRRPPSPHTVLWDKTSQLVKTFLEPLDEREIAHFMCKEQKQDGRIMWSDTYFRFEVLEPEPAEDKV